jgi:acyl-CoA reductase-like NAD-dependent aldehyde dehydrogenase
VRRPLGVVAAITPWNFPLLLAAWKIGPALVAGNTVVLKPSPFTPLTTLRLGEILALQLPPGVVNVVSGGDELGAWMTSHPAVRKISFTGSVVTGKAIAAAVRIVDEEQFGPVLPLIPYHDLDDAIERANATHFGLCGSVWSSDVDRASEVSRRLECGTAYINAHLAIAPHLPFGGTKWSGIGVENGSWGLDEFTNLQVLYRSRA